MTRRLAAAAALALLAGCASFSGDGGRAQVDQLTQARGLAAPVGNTAELLARPLSADDAVTIALLNNRQLQAAYSELGIAEADLVQAGRLSNPSFSFSRLKNHEGVEIERKLMLPIIGLLTMPLTSRIERRHFEQAQMRTAATVLKTADETRRAYFSAVAAQQSAVYMAQVRESAEASADLARRMTAAGNWSRLQEARELAFEADAIAGLAKARQASVAEREKLVRLLGVDGFTLPELLPALPEAAREVKDAEVQAMTNRLDILMAQKELAGLSSSLGLTRATRFVNVLDLSYLREQAPDGERGRGYEVELEIPLFDWGGARVARAEASYMQAVHRTAALAVDARSQVREAHAAYQSAYQLARHYRDVVVPLKKRIAHEQLLRYNGMLIGVFELLADSREQVQSVNAAIEAQRDYWIADAALQAALTGAQP